MYSSMHGEQIELSQAYAGALAGTPSHPSHPPSAADAAPLSGTIKSQVPALTHSRVSLVHVCKHVWLTVMFLKPV